MKSVCCDTRLVFLFCSDSKSSGFSLAGVSFSLHLLKAVQSLTFHGFRNTISVLNLFSVYSPLFFVPLLTLNSKAPYPCLFSSEYSIFLESNCSSFSLVISGLNWERFPTVWLALGGDVETASDQNHAAAETGKLHSNLFSAQSGLFGFQLKIWQFGFWLSHQPKHFHLKLHTQTCLLLVKWGLCHVDLPFTLPNQPEFLWVQCNRKELLGISSATLIFKLSRVFYILSQYFVFMSVKGMSTGVRKCCIMDYLLSGVNMKDVYSVL